MNQWRRLMLMLIAAVCQKSTSPAISLYCHLVLSTDFCMTLCSFISVLFITHYTCMPYVHVCISVGLLAYNKPAAVIPKLLFLQTIPDEQNLKVVLVLFLYKDICENCLLALCNGSLLLGCGLSAPLKLRPYGAIQICLLLLLCHQ